MRSDGWWLCSSTDVLQSAGPFSEQSERVVDEATVRLPERRVVGEGDVFTSSGQQVGGHLHRKQPQELHTTSTEMFNALYVFFFLV